ncbi:inorganic polyphosphate/ATP-NAD kinase [Campylobacter blaseri]|uniref:NAD kinase n=1 Tax=Campylobacter blaseri TaxID=2042961 RepID=A0A2P8R012_9BACT|nr:NAD(+) kinase [Campylobacter blaseri]PSM51833.1 hypothetical protein CQ405_06830 [Campylobacter blaseri]PSM53624.1 hypothetical protein CRN67_06835 [Campylobacter blaseri]QKF86439.1 inorganic polyphosphate/ATP-NAD kinase [Campylobacter blaseri]
MLEENIEIHNNLRAIGLVAKNNSSVDKIISFFKKYNIEVLLNSKDLSLDSICKKTNLIISLGGDGTLISTCREVAKKNIFVLGIYDGNLGFLTDIKLDEMSVFFDDFFKGNYEIERPYMLEAVFRKKGQKDIKKIAFNDVVLSRDSFLSMSDIDAYLNQKYFNTFFGDGIIVSSPAGSTAYNLSANGPIIYPLSKVYVITPIAPHSLTQRPLVLPMEYEISFKSKKDSKIHIVIDGQDFFNMSDFDEIIIKLGKTRANLIRHLNRDYFKVLNDKLRWGSKKGDII